MNTRSIFFLLSVFLIISSLISGSQNQSYNYQVIVDERIYFENNEQKKSPQFPERNAGIPISSKKEGITDLMGDQKMQQIFESIRSSEYNFRKQNNSNIYQCPNRAHNLRAAVSSTGLNLKPRIDTISNDQWFLNLGFDYVNETIITNEESSCIEFKNENRIIFQNSGNIQTEFINNENGFRQNFYINEKNDLTESLTITQNIQTDLYILNESENKISFYKDNKKIISYEGLVAWDSDSTILPARMFVDTISEIAQLVIEINIEHANFPIVIDPLIVDGDLALEQDQASSQFGYAVQSAGNINGDLYNDLIISAPFYDNGQTDEGRVFVFYGSAAGFSPLPVWTAESDQATSYFGKSIGSAGDINNDGYNDILIGAPNFDNGQTDEGKVFLYYGSATIPSAVPDWVYESNQASSLTGTSVSVNHDVNGDGYDDVVIGISKYDNGQTDEGKVSLFYGSASGPAISPSWNFEANSAIALLGGSVASAGDLNGDNFSDIIVAALNYEESASTTEIGKAWIFYGSASGLSATANFEIEGTDEYSHLGNSVGSAGDLNNDGYSDVFAAASSHDGEFSSGGKVLIYYGSAAGLSEINRWQDTGYEINEKFGSSCSGGNDFNNDGYADFVIGAQGHQSNKGAVYFFTGGPDGLNETYTSIIEYNQINAYAGNAVAILPDINNDSYDDLVVGSYLYDNGSIDEGMVFFYYGQDAFPSTLVSLPETNQANSQFGFAVSAGELNSYPNTDLVISAPYFDGGAVDEGKVFILLNGYNWTTLASYSSSMEGNQPGARFGYSISCSSDLDMDGYDDVIIGAPGYDGGENDEGKIYVYKGKISSFDTIVDWTYQSNQIGAQLGTSVAALGDITGDFVPDFCASAPFYTGAISNQGKVYIFKGGAPIPASPLYEIFSDQSNCGFGNSLNSAGDVNSDGYSDFIIGAPDYDATYSDVGRAYLFYGSPEGLYSIDPYIMTGDQLNGKFGYSVNTANDVNGDGFSDVLIGAPGYDNGQTDEGVVYVYYGSTSGINNSDFTLLEQNVSSASFGFCTGPAFDFNLDGYNDIFIGSPSYSGLYLNEGIIQIFSGSDSGIISEPLVSYTAGQTNAQFGFSAVVGKFFTKDNLPDIIVSAPFYDNIEIDEGLAFFFQNKTIISNSSDVDKILLPSSFLLPVIDGNNDFNGDGFEDLIMGLPNLSNPELSEGGAAAYYGDSTGINYIYDWLIESNDDNTNYGNNIVCIGDVNGDGFDDAGWGNGTYSNPSGQEGVVYLYYGSSSGLPNTYSIKIEGNSAQRYLGYNLCKAGDLNGDGIDDLVVGCAGIGDAYYNGQDDEGAVYIFFGSLAGIPTIPDQIIESNIVGRKFGFRTAPAGDVNADGYADLLVTSHATETIDLFYGSAVGLITTSAWTMTNGAPSTQFGYRLASADFNNDGYSDILTSATGYDNIESDEGRLYLYYGSATGPSTTPDWTLESNFGHDYANNSINFGGSLTVDGDFNNDGYNDLVVSLTGMDSDYDPDYVPAKYNIGEIRLYLGGENGFKNFPDAKWNSNSAYHSLGFYVDFAGDINNDGFDDFICTESATYSVNIYYGYDLESTGDNQYFEGDQSNANFGNEVFPAGDVNNDGYGDLLVTTPDFKNYNDIMGKIQIYYGNQLGIENNPSWQLEGNEEISTTQTAYPAGDLNHDNISDIIVSSGKEGAMAVFLGSDLGLNSEPDQLIDVPIPGLYSAIPRPFSCGDVNGDGFGDILFSFSGASTGGKAANGIVFLYYGTATGLTEDYVWNYSGAISQDNFGYSISAADVNGDGYSDIIASAPRFTSGVGGDTHCYVFNGSAAGPSVTPDLTITKAWNYGLGKQILNAGDLNADGFDDVIIQSDYDNQTCSIDVNAVHYGSITGIGTVANWTLSATKLPAGRYGIMTSGILPAGDINADGYDDVMIIIGSLNEIHYFYGSSIGLSNFTDFIISDLPNETFTQQLAPSEDCSELQCAGDLTGDGLPDFVIGNPFYHNGTIYSGSIFIQPGNFEPIAPAKTTLIESNQVDAQQGTSVTIIGDVNGDGFADVAAGAPFFDNGQLNEGRVTVFYGSENGISPIADWTAESNKANSNFGISLSGAGDINGDGYDDLIVGAYRFTHSESKEGAAFIYLGSPTGLELSFDSRVEGNQVNAEFGISVSDAGDINADGFDDVIIGCDKFDNGQTDEGRVFIYLGSPSGISDPPFSTLENNKAKSNFGYRVARAGDINGDGYADILVGAPKFSGGQSKEGAVYAYFGSPTGIAGLPWKFESNQVSANLGASLSSAGDVNGDGFADIAAGADLFDNIYTDEGKLFVFYGSNSGLNSVPSFETSNGKLNSHFATAIAGAGDINSDGYDDIAVAAPYYENMNPAEGRIYYFLGSPDGIEESIFWSYESNLNASTLGFSLDMQGDINMDGYNDLIAGMPFYTNTELSEGGFMLLNGNGSDNRKNTIQLFTSDFAGPPDAASIADATIGFNFYATGKTQEENVVWEVVNEGEPFSSPSTGPISNSTFYSDYIDTTYVLAPDYILSGQITKTGDINKFRMREQFTADNYPTFQRYGVWRYPGSAILKGPLLKEMEEKPELPFANYIAVFPNPATEFIHWNTQLQTKGNYTIMIYDMTGKLILTENYLSDQSPSINISSLASGSYIFMLIDDFDVYRSRFIKLK